MALTPYEIRDDCVRLAAGDRLDYRFEATSPSRSRSTIAKASPSLAPIVREPSRGDAGVFLAVAAARLLPRVGGRASPARSSTTGCASGRPRERQRPHAAVRSRRDADRQLRGHFALDPARARRAWRTCRRRRAHCEAASGRRCAPRSRGCSARTTPIASSARSRTIASATPRSAGARTVVYDGVAPVVAALRAAGAQLVLCTSKPQPYAERIVAHFGLAPHFASIHGADLARHTRRQVEARGAPARARKPRRPTRAR